ncbi:MAG: cold shock domain-containing protein [Deltaproteobacteria bacterium]|nr:MAG: cold shock domain-containing protein [Deltaproteobacteria bacterium]
MLRRSPDRQSQPDGAADKGFGFIAPDDGSEDVFFHRAHLGPRAQFEELRDGDQVVFQTRRGEKGPQAFDVKLR